MKPITKRRGILSLILIAVFSSYYFFGPSEEIVYFEEASEEPTLRDSLVVNHGQKQALISKSAESLVPGEQSEREVAFSANPLYELSRGKDNLLIYPDTNRIEREYTKGVVFNESIFRPITGELQGALTMTELTKSAVEASMDLSSVERFLESDAEYLPIVTSASEHVLVKIERVVERGAHSVTLSGRVKDEPYSVALFVFHDGAVAGSVELTESATYYEYGMAGNGSVAVRTMDSSKDLYGECLSCTSGFGHDSILNDQDFVRAESTSVENVSAASASEDYENVIDVVLSYSTDVKEALGRVSAAEAKMLAGIGLINTNMTNSNIEDLYVTLLGTTEEVGYTVTGGSAAEQMRYEQNMAINYIAELLGADCLGHVYNGGGGGAYLGRGYFAAGRTAMGNSAASFPHEFGHTMGCTHAWADESTSANVNAENYGWRFLTPAGSRIRTLMSYNDGWPGSRIGYYSSPDNLYQTVRMGAERGYDASDDATVDPQLVSGGGSGNGGAGYDGTNPNLGANNRNTVIGMTFSAKSRATRSTAGVIEPVAGSLLFHGHTASISWLGGDSTQTASVDLYKGGVFQSSILTVAAHLRWQDWTVPEVVFGADYTIRVTFDGVDTYESGVFTIRPIEAYSEDIAIDAIVELPVSVTLPSIPGETLGYSYSQPSNGVLTGVAPHLTYTSEPGVQSDSFTYYTSLQGQDSASSTVSLNLVDAVAHWSLDDASGNVVSDISGNGHHGTLVSGTWADGKLAGSLAFNGGTDSVTLPVSAFAALDKQLTLSMWVYGDATQPAEDSVFGMVDAEGARMSDIRIGSPSREYVGNYWSVGYGGYSATLSKELIDESQYKGQWNHYLFTQHADAEELKIYLNGQLWAEREIDYPVSGVAAASLGSYLGEDNYHGRIDDLRLYDMAMTEEAVYAFFNKVPPSANPQTITVARNQSVSITLSAPGEPESFTVVDLPRQGSLSGTAPDLVYTPNADFAGGDSFTFRVNNGVLDSELATVSILVLPAGTNLAFTDLDKALTGNTLKVGGATTGVSVSGETSSNNYIYSVTYTGSDYDGDSLDDTLTFEVLVEGWSGGTIAVSEGTVSSGGAAVIGLTDSAVFLGNEGFSVGDANMNDGESLKFTLQNLSVSLTDVTKSGHAAATGFVRTFLDETGNYGHQTVIGEGSGLREAYWNSSTQNLGAFDTDSEPLYISSALNRNHLNGYKWQIQDVDFGILVAVLDAGTTIKGTSHSWLDDYALVADGGYEVADLIDSDGDRLLNWQEYQAGTNPTDSASVFKVDSHDLEESGFTITWSSVSGQIYTVSWSSDLLSGWTPIDTAINLPATPPQNSFTVEPSSALQGFYRVSTQPAEE